MSVGTLLTNSLVSKVSNKNCKLIQMILLDNVDIVFILGHILHVLPFSHFINVRNSV